jgi:phytoene dehydrogenase-like protein
VNCGSAPAVAREDDFYSKVSRDPRAEASLAVVVLILIAPSDLSHKIRGIDILTPDDLLARNPNAVNGDPYGGSAELDQSLLWRPLASSGRHATPIDRLWHIGASTNPGAGLAGASGHSVATTLIQQANRAG